MAERAFTTIRAGIARCHAITQPNTREEFPDEVLVEHFVARWLEVWDGIHLMTQGG